MSNDYVITIREQTQTDGSVRRFRFGKNWRRFLAYLTDTRIEEAKKSLCAMIGTQDLNGSSFLDIGCGSGLFSLAAMQLGASRVYSFDFDPQSVACAHELKDRFFPENTNWTIQQGSVLDHEFLSVLGQFDIVYSWGVLHHTGDLWQALENTVPLVRPRGCLFIALYNDQAWVSNVWRGIKKLYNRNFLWRVVIVPVFLVYFVLRGLVKDCLILRKNPLSRYREYKNSRGMAWTTDLLDWLGGYPFEVARPDSVFDFFRARGFELVRLRTVGGALGNNEFVFRRGAE